MATVGNVWPTISDWVKRRDPDGQLAKIVESLEKKNPILQDIPMVEGNLDTGHQITNRMALPAPTYRRINQGYGSTKSTTDQVVETLSILEGRSEIDVEHPGIKKGGPAFRASEDAAFVSAFNNEIATGIFYNSTKTTPEKFHGLTPRLDVTAANPAAAQIIKGDAAKYSAIGAASGAEQSSIWLMGLSPETVFGFFPAGSAGGFDMQDLGMQLVNDASAVNTNRFLAWVTRFVWRMGLGVADYRYVARICNLDSSALNAAGPATVSIPLMMQDAIASIYAPDAANLRFYMNRYIFSFMNMQLMNKTANLLEWIDMGGRRVPSFLGIPIRVTDALIATEAVVT